MPAGGEPANPRPWEAWLARLLSVRAVRLVHGILNGYDSVGGGLLAGGLAYAALFALVPGVLLILGIAGAVLGDGRLHDAFVNNVVAVVPPLRDLLGPAVDELTDRAGSMTILGVIGLSWGSSRFYNDFEAAMAKVFGGVSQRGFVRKTLLGLLSVGALGMVFVLVTILAGVRAYLDAAAGPGVRPIAGLAGLLLDLAGPIGVVLAIGAVYRFVPPRRPAWRTVVLPSIVVTAVLVGVARLFVLLAPQLIGAAALLGTLATVFAALAWLGISFQAILMGAAWIDIKDRELAEASISAS